MRSENEIARPPWLEDGQWVVSRYADVCAVLSDPRFVVPRVPTGTTGMDWLRGAVSRFSNGAVHARRRARAVEVISSLDPAALRREALRRTVAALGEQASSPGDGLEDEPAPAVPSSRVEGVAGQVHVAVLATALGVPADDSAEAARVVAVLAECYFTGSGDPGSADQALVRLSQLFGGPDPETLATLAGLLIQACDSTAELIRDALALPGTGVPVDGPPVAGRTVEEALAETLHHDPPVRLGQRGRRPWRSPIVWPGCPAW